MNKNLKYALIGGGALIAGYFIYKKFFSKTEKLFKAYPKASYFLAWDSIAALVLSDHRGSYSKTSIFETLTFVSTIETHYLLCTLIVITKQ